LARFRLGILEIQDKGMQIRKGRSGGGVGGRAVDVNAAPTGPFSFELNPFGLKPLAGDS
jgi:hypothetical protein